VHSGSADSGSACSGSSVAELGLGGQRACLAVLGARGQGSWVGCSEVVELEASCSRGSRTAEVAAG
jgi:hypothetical protein